MWAFNLSFLVFILFAQSSLFGQGLYIKPLQASGKLPSNEIYQIKQDPLGFIWVATELGLFQFDGIQFREWYCPQIGRQSISNIKIHSNGDLFCRDFNGGIFKKEGDSLRLIMQLSNAEPSGSIFTLDSAGNIWFVHQKMLQQCNPQGRIMRTISLQKTMRSRLVYDLIHWGNRIYWFDQVGDIGYYDFGNSIQGMLPAIESVVPHSYFCFISIANELFRFSFSAQDACYYLYSLENTMKLKIKVPFPGDIGRIHALNSEQNSLFINTTSGVYEFRMNQQELKWWFQVASAKLSS
jgi:hypothetical protein